MLTRIRSRLILMIFSYLLLVIVVATVMIYRFYAGEIRERGELLFRQAIEDISLQIDGVFEEMDTLSTQLLSSETMQEIFLRASESADDINYFDHHIGDLRTVQDILWAFNSPKSRIYNVSIFNESNYSGLRFTPSLSRIKEVSAQPVWDTVLPDDFYKIISPHTSFWDTVNNKRVISLFRPYIASDYGFPDLGIIEIEEDFTKISDICENGMSITNGNILILDDSGELIYSTYDEPHMFEDTDSIMETSGTPHTSIRIDGNQFRMAKAELGWAPWTVVILQAEEFFTDPLQQFIRDLVIVISLLTLLVLLVIILIINAVTKPIYMLVDEIDNYSLEQGEPNFHHYPVVEVSVIQAAFIRLIGRLTESVNQLMLAHKTELNLRIMNLQAKINPHFLFNSLTAISSIGMEEGSPTVPVMCAQLSNLFRYTSNTTDEGAATLKEEVDNIRLYMDFMKWRYEDNFLFNVQEDGDLARISIPKLVLQPLIENSFTHGFKQSHPPYRIEVVAHADDQGWEITIIDNGGGFPPLKLAALQESIAAVNTIFFRGKDYQELKTNDQAILNIYIRLKLQYREGLSMQLENSGEGGARICIKAVGLSAKAVPQETGIKGVTE